MVWGSVWDGDLGSGGGSAGSSSGFASSCRGVRSSCGRSSVGGAASLGRWPLETEQHGVAVALHPLLVAMVLSSAQDSILVMPLPPQVPEAEPARVPKRQRTLSAPSGPIRALKFAEGCGEGPQVRALLLAAAPHEVYLWDLGVAHPAEPLRLVGIFAPPPAAPTLAFDETGSLVAVGGVAGNGVPRLAIFNVLDGGALANAHVPAAGGATQGAEEPPTASCFLWGDFAFVLIAAVSIAGSQQGAVFAYDLRGCGGSELEGRGIKPAHETEALDGAPFAAACPHRAQASVFVLGGEGSVRLLQVREQPGGSLACTRLTEVPLGGGGPPVWLRSRGPGECEEDDSAQTRASEEGLEAVLALGGLGCRVLDGPPSLRLSGTVIAAITAGAVHAVWSHQRTAERLASLPASGAAAVCVVPRAGASVLLAAVLHAFAGGGEVLRFALGPELELGEEASAAAAPCDEPPSLLAAVLGLDTEEADALAEPPICSVVPLGPIPPDSVLGRALARPTSASGSAGSGKPQRRAGSAPHRDRSHNSINQPVTFHRKIKSAGYGPPTEPPRALGRPRLSASKAAPAPKPDFGPPTPSKGSRQPARPRSAAGAAGAGRGALECGYAAARAGPPLEHCPEYSLHPYEACAVVDLCYSPQASHLVLAGSDRTICSYRLPLSKARAPGDGPPRALGLGGHQADVVSLSPSYTESHSTGGGGGPLLLSSATDRTARLWALSGTHAGGELLCFDRLRTNCRPAHREENPQLEQVQDAQFLCLDGAIVLALGSRLGIYKYELHVQDTSDDIKRLQRLGSYKCCGILSLPKDPSAGNSIVAVAVSNSVISGTALVASSSKRIYVWDVAAEKVLSTVPESSLHARPITCLRLAQPHSEFQSPQSMDLFYTAAMDGTVKLWDLRSMQECRCFEGAHTHTSQRLKCRLSPCLRYMCTPSEDGSVCIYDVRTGGVLGSQHRHRDTVCAVDVHPRTGAMASGGFDGKVQFFRAPLPAAPKKAAGRGPGNNLERPGSGKVREARVREVEMDLPF